jgi:hypothetical protein
MMAEKYWEGIAGFQITDDVRITIAGTASLLELGMDAARYFDRVTTILVAARPISVRKPHSGYVVDESESILSGQAWQDGRLVFSWSDVMADVQKPGNGHNVVIHEFAHHLDGLDGEMGGMPPIQSQALRARWKIAFPAALEELHRDIVQLRQPAIDPYGSASPAEFFAVVTENFFDAPYRLRARLPLIFEILKEYFRIDPIQFRI